MLHDPSTSIFLGILGFSLLVAGLDFVKRRAGNRLLEAMSPSTPPDPQPQIAELELTPVAEPRTEAPIRGVAYLPDVSRSLAPTLPLADFLALPKPNPGLPRNGGCLPKSVSWQVFPG